MTTAEDLLKKAEARKKKGTEKFQPQKRRAWDYLIQKSSDESNVKQYQTSEQHSNNIGTDIGTIGNKYSNNTGTDIGTIGNKYGNNWEQIWEQSSNKNGDEYRNNIEEQATTTQINQTLKSQKTITSSIDTTTEAYVLKTLRKTAGHQQKIMAQITAHIKSMKEIVNVVDIHISTLSNRINTDKGTTRTSIKRLQKKSILLRAKGERGRHGCTQVIVPDFIIKECLNLFECQPFSLEEIGYKNGNENRNIDFIYSSSNIINTTTKNTEFPENWASINFEPLKEMGFAATQLKQLHSKELNTPEIIQESINHFAFGLKNNPKVKQYPEPLNVLMGVLRKGQAWVEPNYRSPQEIAQEQLIKSRKAERARLKQLEDDAYDLAFEEWQETLTVEQLEEIAPPKNKTGDCIPQRVKLSLYFKKNEWDEKKKDYLII